MIELFSELSAFDFITFVDDHHIYVDQDDNRFQSVSSFISKYSKPFDSDRIATFVAKKRGTTKDVILHEWKGDQVKGTVFHLLAESYLANKIITYPSAFIKQELGSDVISQRVLTIFNMFKNFYAHSQGKLIPIKSELVVADRELNLGGMIDQLFYNVKAQEFQLWDWKTNKNIKMSNDYGEKMMDPISHLDSCEIVKYSIQLQMYKHIIEKNTKLKIGKCYVAWFQENNPTYQCIETLELKDELPILINHYKENYVNT